MLGEIFKAVFITSLAGSLLAAVITMLKPVTKRIFGAAWHYYIWLAVLFVMVLPVRFSPLQSNTDISVINTQTVQTGQPAEDVPVNIAEAAPDTETANTSTATQKAANFIGTVIAEHVNDLGIIWLFGTVLLLMISTVGYIRLITKIRKKCAVISCPEALNYTGKKITVRAGKALSSPFMLGVLRPTLVLPDKELSAEQLNNILRHEMTHFRRKDILYKWFTLLVRCVHWFNPIVYYAARQISNECEISCDLSVVSRMNSSEQMSYINTILSLVSIDHAKRVPLTTQMASGKKILKRRFTMIKKAKKTSKRMSVISAVLAVIMLGTTVFASGVIAGQTEGIGRIGGADGPTAIFVTEGSAIEITNNGEKIELVNQPFIENGTLYVPLREAVEKLDKNAEVEWENNSISIDITGNRYLLIIGDYSISVDPAAAQEAAFTATADKPPVLKGSTAYIPFDTLVYLFTCDQNGSYAFNYKIYDKNGNPDGTVFTGSENLKNPRSAIYGFFMAFEESNFTLMKNYCTEKCISTYFRDGYCFGMTKAALAEISIDPLEYAKSSNDFNVFVTVNMTPHEKSVFDPSETSASFYIILQRQPDGSYLIDKLVTGL